MAIENLPIRGKPKSGRTWKTVREKRYSSIKKDKCLRVNFKKRQIVEQQLKRTKELDQKLREQRAENKRTKRIREEEKRQKKLENERRSEVVVPVSSASLPYLKFADQKYGKNKKDEETSAEKYCKAVICTENNTDFSLCN